MSRTYRTTVRDHNATARRVAVEQAERQARDLVSLVGESRALALLASLPGPVAARVRAAVVRQTRRAS